MEEANFDFQSSKVKQDTFAQNNENFKDGKKYFGYTKKQLITIVIFGIANLFSCTVISLQAPFYPKEAEDRGATATEYGFVMGIFQLVTFIMSPIYGSIIGLVNPRAVFNIGILTTGSCAILFGFLDYISDRVTFITLSFVLRIVQACGGAAFVTASFTIITLEFPESVAATFATFETFCGIGLLVGPSLGGVLYEVGGFLLPFLSLGGCLLTVAVLATFLLPDVRGSPSSGEDKDGQDNSGYKIGVFSMLAIPSVALAFFSIVVSASSSGFLTATLEPHLRENFGLSPALAGLIFIIEGGAYSISAPFTGTLCDKSNQPKYFTVAGAALSFAGFLFIGPVPFIPLESSLWLVCLGLLLHGIGTGASFVSAFVQALQGSVKNGFLDNMWTYGLVSGLWISSFSLGACIGPSIGGILLDVFGFKSGTLFVLGSLAFVIFLTVLSICAPNTKYKSQKSDDTEKKTLIKNEHFKNTSTINLQEYLNEKNPENSNSQGYGSI